VRGWYDGLGWVGVLGGARAGGQLVNCDPPEGASSSWSYAGLGLTPIACSEDDMGGEVGDLGID
jgi:hypothetical protein